MVDWSFSKWRWRASVPFSVSPPPGRKHGLTHFSICEIKHSEDRARTRDLDCATHKRGRSCSAVGGDPSPPRGTTHQAENHTCARSRARHLTALRVVTPSFLPCCSRARHVHAQDNTRRCTCVAAVSFSSGFRGRTARLCSLSFLVARPRWPSLRRLPSL